MTPEDGPCFETTGGRDPRPTLVETDDGSGIVVVSELGGDGAWIAIGAQSLEENMA